MSELATRFHDKCGGRMRPIAETTSPMRTTQRRTT